MYEINGPTYSTKFFFIMRSSQTSNIFSGLAFATPAVSTMSECVQTPFSACLVLLSDKSMVNLRGNQGCIPSVQAKKSLAKHKVIMKD